MLDNTVEELMERVRDITDESNTTDISDALVLRMLNRAQQELVRILSRRNNSYFKREVIYTSSDLKADANSATRVLDIPSQAFGFAVNSVDVKTGSAWLPVQQVPFNYTLGLDNASSSSLPCMYAILGNKLYLYNSPDSSVSIRVRYQFRAPKLVKSQGRIVTLTDVSSNQIELDSLGSSLSTDVDSLAAFVNIVDHLTGEIKATMQVSDGVSSSDKVLTMASSADRSIVFGYTVTGTMPTTVALDDLVCTADGTCVPYLSHDLTNFLVDIAGFYVKRKLGTVEQADFADRDEIIKAVKGMNFGRQQTKKIKRSDPMGRQNWLSLWFDYN
jgi:hypothetical protein